MSSVFSSILLDRLEGGAVARITLNRPHRLNAVTTEMLEELARALEEIEADEAVRVVVLTGAGRAFCAGADLRQMAGGEEQGPYDASRLSPEQLRRGFRQAQRVILGLQRLERPVIAMVNGPAVGAGFDLACACDLRVGCPDSRFMAGYINIGLFPGYGGTWLYPRALGSLGRAAELLFTGEWLGAEEAYRWGLLNRLVERERLEEETLALAQQIAEKPPIALRLSKLMLYRGLEFDLETAMLMSATAETITLTSEDHREGLSAFREKRKPRYKGR